MNYAQLGKTDLTVSRICFGCWQLSPSFWGEVPLAPWEDAVRAALDLGVNFMDTADAYGNGHAETALGNLMHRDGLRGKVVLATKFFWNFEQEGVRFGDTRYEHILRACEASLRRLKTDCIDLYQIHAFDPLTRPDEVAAALLDLKRQGKIRWIGVSNLNPEQMRMYGRHFEVASLQPPYSLLQRAAEERIFPYVLTERIGVLVYSPLYRGLLAGLYREGQEYGDSRDRHPHFSGPVFERILQAIEEVRPIADRLGLTPAQFAVRWVLTHPAVTSAIVGVKRRSHIEGTALAAGVPLPVADWHRAAEIMARALDGTPR